MSVIRAMGFFCSSFLQLSVLLTLAPNATLDRRRAMPIPVDENEP